NNNNNNNKPPAINYSKQCQRGHVINLLELRRLSSRGIPDEPPEPRHRASSAPSPRLHDDNGGSDVASPGNGSDQVGQGLRSSASAGNIQSPGGNPHRSYRPLVWRVLLGYLPPETDLWNEVLTRDRKLYANFVQEMFSSTCPAPHEMYDEEAWKRRQVEEEEYKKTPSFLSGNKVYRSNGTESNSENNTPVTPGAEETPSSQPDMGTPHPLTPGLLSARMQQEWVRGEESVFRTPSGRSLSGDEDGNPSATSRISPLCAMNTPRVRSRKQHSSIVKTINEEKEDEILSSKSSLGTGEHSAGFTEFMTQSSTNDGEKELTGMMKTLLLPDDLEEAGETEETMAPHEDHERRMTRSISITTADSGKQEAVEVCRQGSNDDEKRKPSVPLSPSMDLDEEENTLLLDEIRKDVIRTHPDLRFFLEPKDDLGQKRYAALERILFVWAKLNKGVRYVQGMNEIVGTLYFVLAHDSNEDWANEAEADTYFLFNSLMVEMRDVFVPDLDEADTGIHGRISNMITLLALHDPEVRCHLDSVGIDPSFYSVRWLTTLLSREFLLPDTIRLWDSMFASTHKDNFLRYVSVTMVMVIRNQLLQGDFSTCLRLLQAYPPTNLDRLLESSRALWIYESQITLACHKGGISLGHALRSICPPPAIIMAYGLHGGIAPPIRDQVRQVGERGLAAAKGAANGASHSVANAGRSFLGNAMEYWRSGSSVSKQKKDMQRARSMT
ncbi:hypothetical protein ACHAW6_013326, partial [Cyclotella cf. meneghiniana]